MDEKDRRVFGLLSLAVLAVTAAAIVQASRPPWKAYQRAFYALAARLENDPGARSRLLRAPLEIKQILLPGLHRVDRCPTCHLGIEDPALRDAPHPFRAHPDLGPHRIARFGCTVCHGGQGLATEKNAAHGPVANWLEPRLPKRYLLAACGRCHKEGEIPGAPEMEAARRIFWTRGCPGCHRLNGFGNTIGPDLSDEARKERTPEWLEQHFRDPRSVTPTSPMPDFRFSREEIEALTLFVLSLTTAPMADYYLSVPVLPTAGQGRQLFAQAGCIGCHSLQGAGGRAASDLAGITERRSTRFLERQLEQPDLSARPASMPIYSFPPAARRALIAFLRQAGAADARALLEQRPRGLDPAMVQIENGRRRTLKFGCVGCHGQDLKGGVKNPNSQGGEVPALIHLADDYTPEEVKAIIRRGKTPALEDPNKPAPPLYMPTWNKVLTEEDIERILAYAWSLRPREAEAW
jgi:mono/diheme cytochrome c family protein